MCGRYVQTRTTLELLRRFGVVRPCGERALRFNIAPTQDVWAVVMEDGERRLRSLRWGLVPRWAHSAAAGAHMINARVETVAEKPAFREAFAQRRCLIPADGFYEWRKEPGGGKTPMCIRLRDHAAFAFAGIWERWSAANGTMIETCTVITVPANEKISDIHDRMPAILRSEDEAAWLNPATDANALMAMLTPLPGEAFVVHPVSDRVNQVGVDEPSLLDPVNPPAHRQGTLF